MIDVKATLPDALRIGFIGDQSIFVRGALTAVAREGVIAALLTSVMILLFLGSWRSTIIIATSIPLAVIGAIIMLAAIGETLNIMTLGGLALAVGILVDDATVTIENINWHLEQGKDVRTGDPGRRQPDRGAGLCFLLCICIVFVPMFFLQGVARFLFVPMAEAVVFAMIWSFILSRTLVPTMAMYLLQPHVHHSDQARPAAVAQSTGRVAARFRGRLRAVPQRLQRYSCRWRCITARSSSIGFLAFVAASFLLMPYLGRNFFPSVDAGADPDACAHPGRHPPRGERQSIRRRAEGDPQDHPAG